MAPPEALSRRGSLWRDGSQTGVVSWVVGPCGSSWRDRYLLSDRFNIINLQIIQLDLRVLLPDVTKAVALSEEIAAEALASHKGALRDAGRLPAPRRARDGFGEGSDS